MNFVHIHLLLNHFPVIGSIIGFGLFVISLVGKSEALRRKSSLIVFATHGSDCDPDSLAASGKGAAN